jgi:hypothetical protein
MESVLPSDCYLNGGEIEATGGGGGGGGSLRRRAASGPAALGGACGAAGCLLFSRLGDGRREMDARRQCEAVGWAVSGSGLRLGGRDTSRLSRRHLLSAR